MKLNWDFMRFQRFKWGLPEKWILYGMKIISMQRKSCLMARGSGFCNQASEFCS